MKESVFGFGPVVAEPPPAPTTAIAAARMKSVPAVAMRRREIVDLCDFIEFRFGMALYLAKMPDNGWLIFEIEPSKSRILCGFYKKNRLDSWAPHRQARNR